jgi:hypothetical protein
MRTDAYNFYKMGHGFSTRGPPVCFVRPTYIYHMLFVGLEAYQLLRLFARPGVYALFQSKIHKL